MSHSDAKLFRDTIQSIVRETLAKEMPPDRYARVEGFVEGERRVIVQYNGEPEGNHVTLPYNSVVPSYVGQWVRVGGSANDRHVVDLLGPPESERRVQEMSGQAYVPPKWLAMDLRLVTTYPMPMFTEDYATMAIASGTIYGTMMRVPWDISVSQMMCYVAGVEGGGSGALGLALYDVDDAYNLTLIQSIAFVRSGSAAEYRKTFSDGRADLRRSQQVVAAAWNGSNQPVSIPYVLTRPERSLDAADFLSFSLPGQTSIPAYIARASIPTDRVRKDAMIHLSLLDVRE